MRLLLFSLVVAPTAAAQTTPLPAPAGTALPATAVRHAGTLHLATGTWTRSGGSVSAFGPDVIYSNTAPSGYFSSAGGPGHFAQGSRIYCEGGLPGTTNAGPFTGVPDRDSYLVNGFQFGYCDLGAPASGGWEISFFSSFTYCTPNPSPDETLLLTGLPANGGCWTIDVDLVGSEFCLEADGGPANPGWQDDPDLDSFAWSYRYAGSDLASGNAAGFLIAGNPNATDPTFGATSGIPRDGGHTYYGTTACPGLGSGYLARDFFLLEDPAGTYTNCYFFGGYRSNTTACTALPRSPFAAFHMQIAADTAPCGPVCLCGSYCSSNPNSTGVNGGMQAWGSAVAVEDDVRLEASSLPPDAFGFFIVSETQGFVANPGGSEGNLCVLGSIGRFIAPGQVKDSGSAGRITLDTNLGEWSLTAIPSASGPYAASTGLTSNFQLWHRDVVAGTPTSNFTDALTVTWL